MSPISKSRKVLTPLEQILVPRPAAEETYRSQIGDRGFAFQGLKSLLGAADYSKAGDRTAKLAAADDLERESAREILASLSLEHLYEHPLVDPRGQVDDVLRVNYDMDHTIFSSIARLTLGELKDHLLRQPSESILPLGQGLTGPMVAAVAKLCDVHELIYLARKLPRVSQARTTLGLPGTLASRLQPNHPTDDPRAITLLVAWGLSLAAGDALIGLNPAMDTTDSVTAALALLDKLRHTHAVPTQICVLAHIKTQLAALERGAPVEILFQSLAGTQRTLGEEFDVTVQLLDRGYQTMGESGPLRDVTNQTLYFETGQGSEFTYGKHNGIDMTTTEALCYGLARRYDPFMVNNVTGFIGPETHCDNFEMIASNLQDHFMGKLLGLPMGMAPCFTLHSHITLEGQQMATQLLASAGSNYYMDVALNTDRMLAYYDTSGHDDQTLREIHDRKPAPEYLSWATQRGILAQDAEGRVSRGEAWGAVGAFFGSERECESLRQRTPLALDFATAGPRPLDAVSRQVRLAMAGGREAIYAELDIEALRKTAHFHVLSTQAVDKADHLNSPELGSHLSAEDFDSLKRADHPIQIVVSDGLSAPAVHQNVPELLAVLDDAFTARGYRLGRPLLVRYGRVKVAEEIAERTGAELVILLIGERPGAETRTSQSLSAYLLFRGQPSDAREVPGQAGSEGAVAAGKVAGCEYTVLSNIHSGGIPAVEAGGWVAEKAFQILKYRAAGNRLEEILRKAD